MLEEISEGKTIGILLQVNFNLSHHFYRLKLSDVATSSWATLDQVSLGICMLIENLMVHCILK